MKLNNPTFYLKKLFINIDFCTKTAVAQGSVYREGINSYWAVVLGLIAGLQSLRGIFEQISEFLILGSPLHHQATQSESPALKSWITFCDALPSQDISL